MWAFDILSKKDSVSLWWSTHILISTQNLHAIPETQQSQTATPQLAFETHKIRTSTQITAYKRRCQRVVCCMHLPCGSTMFEYCFASVTYWYSDMKLFLHLSRPGFASNSNQLLWHKNRAAFGIFLLNNEL